MKIHVENILSPYYDVIDNETNKRVGYCIWADDKKRKFEAYKIDENGKIMIKNKEAQTKIIEKPLTIIRKHSYFYMFFDSMIRIYKHLLFLKSIESTKQKEKIKLRREIEKNIRRKNNGRIS